jgi:hypothetical protein
LGIVACPLLLRLLIADALHCICITNSNTNDAILQGIHRTASSPRCV